MEEIRLTIREHRPGIAKGRQSDPLGAGHHGKLGGHPAGP